MNDVTWKARGLGTNPCENHAATYSWNSKTHCCHLKRQKTLWDHEQREQNLLLQFHEHKGSINMPGKHLLWVWDVEAVGPAETSTVLAGRCHFNDSEIVRLHMMRSEGKKHWLDVFFCCEDSYAAIRSGQTTSIIARGSQARYFLQSYLIWHISPQSTWAGW